MSQFRALQSQPSSPLSKDFTQSRASTPFEIQIVESESDRKDLYTMRRRAYAEFLDEPPAGPDEEYRDSFDDAVTTAQVGAYDFSPDSASHERQLIGAMRLCFSRPWDRLGTLPCANYYPELKTVKRAARGSLMEVSRLAIDTDITNTSYRTTLYASLVRTGLIAAEAANVSTILIATRPEWVRFYKYMLGFELIGEPAYYPPGDMKIALLAGSLDQARKRQRMQNAFFRICPDEIATMRRALGPMLTRAAAA